MNVVGLSLHMRTNQVAVDDVQNYQHPLKESLEMQHNMVCIEANKYLGIARWKVESGN